jgi:hypothetical protein
VNKNVSSGTSRPKLQVRKLPVSQSIEQEINSLTDVSWITALLVVNEQMLSITVWPESQNSPMT